MLLRMVWQASTVDSIAIYDHAGVIRGFGNGFVPLMLGAPEQVDGAGIRAYATQKVSRR